MFAFAGQNLLPDLVMLVIMVLISPWDTPYLWKAQNDTFENLVLGTKLFRAEVFLWLKCASGPK